MLSYSIEADEKKNSLVSILSDIHNYNHVQITVDKSVNGLIYLKLCLRL